jgi:hypothetical protein
MTINDLKSRRLLLLECISGSRAYGLHTHQSDTDIKGVFLLPKENFYGLEYIDQVNNDSNDEVYYELKRFVDLLTKNNPNILELLATPEDCILYRHPAMNEIKPELFLSKLCMQTFAGYAESQIKKARGLNKKIVNPISEERKSILDFCYVVKGQGSASLNSWLSDHGYRQEECGLINIPHMRDMYHVFHASQLSQGHFRGIVSGPDAHDVLLSSIPQGIEPLTMMSFNKDGYTKYCKDYKQYWEWVEKRNEIRYESTLEHGKNYDAKNMMHTFRLLNMAEEIAREGKINVRRHDREFLLNIRSGNFEYDTLLEMANEKVKEVEEQFAKSDLPDEPDIQKANGLLVSLREKIYKERN